MKIVLVYLGLILLTASICLNTIYFDNAVSHNSLNFVEISGISG